jgi:hypothetical protein
VVATAVHDADAVHLRREALEMGLYVSITLLAALTAVAGESVSDLDVLAIVWGTTVGLALAHWFAFTLAARLVDPEREHGDLTGELVAQLAAAAAVAVIASLPVLLLPEDVERSGARFATALCIGATAFAETRSVGATRVRAAAFAAVVLLLALVVAGVKHALGH